MTRLITERDAADRLSVSPRTIRNWRDRGLLSSIQIGRVRRYDPDEIERLVERHRTRSTHA